MASGVVVGANTGAARLMRKSVIIPVVLHTLAGGSALLCLLWFFIPAGNVLKGLLTLLIIILSACFIWRNSRRRDTQKSNAVSAIKLPLLDTQGPIVLVCGDALDEKFQGQSLRKTAQGWWLRAGEVIYLTDIVRCILAQYPCQTGQLSVMYVCHLDKHQDEAVLRAELKSLRQQSKQLSSLIGFTLPIVISCELSGPETPWIVVHGDKPIVCPINESPLALIDWQQTDNNHRVIPVLSQAFSLIREIHLDEMAKADRLTPPVDVFAVALRLRAENHKLSSIWTDWLYHRTCLTFSVMDRQAAPTRHFPDAILPLLAPFSSPAQGGQLTRRVVVLVWLCALLAIGCSATNNRNLIRTIGADLQRWSAIPMNHYVPKAESLAALKQDALLLERWQRQGEPVRYSLGYYPGQQLWLALHQAIDMYIPPQAPQIPEVEAAPKIVRLDSMSLFDSGKSLLKTGSTKMLINSLVDIKAKPGWLIVVSGHTDNTGSREKNQALSLQRAESVRNWMRDTGDIPESCFAVQGYGDSRPMASNDTPDGRAHNRRVEISLVPQADACRVSDTKPASQDERDVLTQEMEI